MTLVSIVDTIVIQIITYYYNTMRQILNISLPMSMVKTIKQEVKEGGFASVSEFIRHLIRLYNTEKLARELKRDQKLIRQGKMKLIEVDSLRDLLDENEDFSDTQVQKAT